MLAVVLTSTLVPTLPAYGQDIISFRIAPATQPDDAGALIKVVRTAELLDPRNGVVDDVLNYSLGLQASPLDGLKLDANVWRRQFDSLPSMTRSGDSSFRPELTYGEEPGVDGFRIQNPLPSPNLRSSGFDIGAAYAWDTSRFGEFILSTRASFVQDFYNTEGLLDAVNSNLPAGKLTTPNLRSNLKLSWEFGNHTASAITRYFDSSRDISELGMEEINDLVDNITTLDLEYGYRMAAGDKDRAVISFGIQNVFDRKTMQILNSATRILDQNGRVAYGRLKYQF